MLTRLRFANFKSWADFDIALSPITGIFGTNSSGKSSILQFLLLLKQTKEATDRATVLELDGKLVKLGTFHDLIYKHDKDRTLHWRLEWRMSGPLVLREPGATGDTVAIEAEVAYRDNSPRCTRLRYELGELGFGLEPRKGDERRFDLTATGGVFEFMRRAGRPSHNPGPIKSYAFPDQVRTDHQNAGFLADLEHAYEEALDSVYYLGPMREHPQRDYLWARSRPSDVGSRGERAIDAILSATERNERWNLKRGGRRVPFQEIIAHLLKEMGLIHEFRVEEIKLGSNRWQAKVTTRRGGSEVFLTDVGFGVSQVLPVITLLQYVPEGSTVLLEQPEIHLHPLAQAELADVIIQAAEYRKVQVILESHSEHLLLRLQRRLAEETIKAGNMRLYFCDASSGYSNLTELNLDLFGRIENWPDKFMGDAFGETAQAELARLKRSRGAA
jgi:predicted ATPase